MKKQWIVVLAALVVLAAGTVSQAYYEPNKPAKDEAKDEVKAVPKAKPEAKAKAKVKAVPKATPKVGPKYSNLRHNENFSYLGDPATPHQEDFWDSIKWIKMADDWHLTLGGQARFRLEAETNKNFGGTGRFKPSQDTYGLQRYFIHADLRHKDGLRFFLQVKAAHASSRDVRGSDGKIAKAGFESHADFHQFFMDIPNAYQDATLRLGRQELQYGAQRLISPLDWGNIRRTFTGVKLFADTPGWKVDIFAVRPVLGGRRNLAKEDEQIDFYGIYSTNKGSKALKADFYFLLLKNNNDTGAASTNADGSVGRRTLYTLGTRLWGKQDDWDYEAEFASQFGTFAGDRIKAWMATVGGGYTYADAAWKPKISLLYDYATGDSDPADNIHGTFNQLYPLGHAWFGYLDRVGRSNIHAIKAQIKVKPAKKVIAWADFHTFYADQEKDGLYHAGGSSYRRKATGTGTHSIGHELDVTMKVAVNKHTTTLFGWAHFWPGGFIRRTGDDDAADLIYAQIEYKF